MPSVENISGPTQLETTLLTFTSLTDPQAINDALVILDHALQGVNSTEVAQQILSFIPLHHFLQLLQTDQGDDTEYIVERTCNVLEAVLRDQPYSTLIQDPVLCGALLQALNSPVPRIHALGLSQIDKVAKEDVSILRSMLETDIFKAVVEGIASDSISIAERSKLTLLKICDTQERLQKVINYDGSFCIIRDLTQSKSSIVQLRMIEVLAALAGKSRELLSILEQSGLLDSLKGGLGAADILTRFNIIEILSEFGATTAGSEFLDHSGILTQLATVVGDERNQDSLGVNAIVKLYGKLGASSEVDFVTLDMKYRILSQLERLLIGDDDFEPEESLKVEAMASIGLIGGNVQNIEWVSQSKCSDVFIDRLASLPRDLKVAWYHSLAQILNCSPDPSAETEKVVYEFYRKLERPGQSAFLTRLLVSAKSQSSELAMAALSVMIPLAHYSFGVQSMGTLRDIIIFLLDRNAEISHSEKVAKYEVIEAMLNTFQKMKSVSNIELLTDDQVSRLDLVRRQGPFYRRTTATVAIQDITG